jgi:hypothetical protein
VILIAIAAGFGCLTSTRVRVGTSALGVRRVSREPRGVAGPPGNAASAQHLGVCTDSSTWTCTNAGVPPLLSNVIIDSPQKGKYGTVSCDVDNFVSVSPQGR